MRKLYLFTFFTILLVGNTYAQPANDACASATALTVNGSLLCGQTTNNATTQTGEACAASGGGVTPRTVWYSFTATSSSMILNYLRTNTSNCITRLSIYGPNPTCVPGAGAQLSGFACIDVYTGDPGKYLTMSGLVVGATYLIQVNGQDCGGGNDRFHNFCIGVYTPNTNNSVSAPSVITECGTTYNGSTQGGYSPSGTGVGFRNLDGNNSTTCPSCATAGDDVTFVINNDSWFSFCTVNAGTWQVTFSVGTCVFSGINSGAQMALFTGSPTALTWHSQATNPTYAGGSWTSPTITLAAGGCAYMVVDGFAGDACTYSYTVTNLSGGCILLPIELLSFNYTKEGNNVNIQWKTATETNNDFFTLEKSSDGINYEFFQNIKGAGNSNMPIEYKTKDTNPFEGVTYYRLKQTDYDGNFEYVGTIAVKTNKAVENIAVIPNPVLNNAEINFNSNLNGVSRIQIIDITGKQVYTESINTNEGPNRFVLNTENYNKGLYFLVISNEFGTEKLKFVKE
ncbi:MAG: T9SS type A sorting domain-containing protein [Bacteroidia bacterium]